MTDTSAISQPMPTSSERFCSRPLQPLLVLHKPTRTHTMQKVIRRTALARNQAKRKAIRAEKKEQREEWLTVSRQRASFDRIQHDIVRAERERRREDWMRGPLAPRRDVGTEAKQYGALPATVISQPPIPKHLRRRYFNIHPGDRVCVMKGKDKGKIDEVVRVNMETETVTLKTLNRVRPLLSGRFLWTESVLRLSTLSRQFHLTATPRRPISTFPIFT